MEKKEDETYGREVDEKVPSRRRRRLHVSDESSHHTTSRLRTRSPCVAVSLDRHVALSVATRACDVYPDKMLVCCVVLVLAAL